MKEAFTQHISKALFWKKFEKGKYMWQITPFAVIPGCGVKTAYEELYFKAHLDYKFYHT